MPSLNRWRRQRLARLSSERHRRMRTRARASLAEQLETRMLLAGDVSDGNDRETFNDLVNSLVPRLQTSEFQSSSLDVTPGGDTIVVYGGCGLSDNDGIFIKRFTPDGPAADRRVNVTIREAQSRPSLAIYDDGGYVIAWDGRGPGDQTGVFARWYDADDTPASDEILINEIRGGVQHSVDVDVAADGTTVFVSAGSGGADDPEGVFGRTFDRTGAAVTPQFRINADSAGRQDRPSVAINDDREIVVTWSTRQDVDRRWGIDYRMFAAGDAFDPSGAIAGSGGDGDGGSAGGHQGSAIPASEASQADSRVGIDADDNFLIVWSGFVGADSGTHGGDGGNGDGGNGNSGNGNSGGPAEYWNIYSRHFFNDGTPASDRPRLVNQTVAGNQRNADLAMADDGRHIIAWASGIEDGNGWEVFASVFAAGGDAVESNFRVNMSREGHQNFPIVGIGTGPAVYGWNGRGAVDRRGVWIRQDNFARDPIFPDIDDGTVPEMVPMQISLSAIPADPAQTLRFNLVPGLHPMGMVVDPVSGELTWTPDEIDGPGAYPVTVQVVDANNPEDRATQTFRVNVVEVNRAPVLADMDDVTVGEGVTVTTTAVASDPDIPINGLVYTLVNPPLDAMTIDSASGVIEYETTEADGGRRYLVRVRVTDNGLPTLFDETTFTLAVTETNTPPRLNPIGDRIVPEQTRITVASTAVDDDGDELTFALDPSSIAAGMTIDSDGTVSWVPTEAQGPSIFPVTVTTTDAGGLSDSKSFSIEVREVNRAPRLDPITSFQLSLGQELDVTATATDPDLPVNGLTFSINEAAIASGFSINSQSGQIGFSANTAGVYPVTVRVTDDGAPSLFDETQFVVSVDSLDSPPNITPLPNQTIPELTLLTFDVAATSGIAGDTVTYSLAGVVPLGLQMDSATGTVTWTPTEAQGPGVYEIDVVAAQVSRPDLFATDSIMITVLEINLAPVLTVPTNVTIAEGDTVTTTATATDDGLPRNGLRFPLGSGAPAGVRIDPDTGIDPGAARPDSIGGRTTVRDRIRTNRHAWREHRWFANPVCGFGF